MSPTCDESRGTYSDVKLFGSTSVWLTETTPSSYTIKVVGATCTDGGRPDAAACVPPKHTRARMQKMTNPASFIFSTAQTTRATSKVNNFPGHDSIILE